MKIAAACYPIDWMEGFDCYAAKLGDWVAEAAGQGADLLVFPEYAAFELAALAGRQVAGAGEAALRAISDRLPRAWDIHAELAARHGVHILAGSGPFYDGGAPVNRAMFFAPSGARQAHDKQILTQWERDNTPLVPGCPLTVMDTALGRIGVLICYDAEFPLLGRALIEAGAEIILVPSATDAEAGWTRVRVGAMARALEGQCVTVHAPTQGAAPWNRVVDQNAGAAAIYGPPDEGFAPSGIIAEGRMDAPGWVMADISRETIGAVRAAGHVRGLAHYPEQAARIGAVETLRLA